MRNIGNLQRMVIDKIIQMDPMQVTVTRTTYVEADGGRSKVVSTHGPYPIYLYAVPQNRAIVNVSDMTGQKEEVSWEAVAYHDSDFRFGAFVEDQFTVLDEGTFSVSKVVPIKIGKDVGGYRLYLNRVY